MTTTQPFQRVRDIVLRELGSGEPTAALDLIEAIRQEDIELDPNDIRRALLLLLDLGEIRMAADARLQVAHQLV